MDLLSLPEEMLVSVFKYADIPNLIKYRQISSQIDAVVVRNRLNQPRLKHLCFNVRTEQIVVMVETIDGLKCKKHFPFNDENRDETLYAVIQNIYLKIRYIRLFTMNNFSGKQVNVPKRILEMLIASSKKRRISGISILSFHLDMDLTLIRKLLSSFNNTDFGLHLCKTPNLVQVNLLFDDLYLQFLIFVVAGLALRDIKMICNKNVPEILWVRCKDVTFNEAVEFLVDVLNRRKKNFFVNLSGLLANGLQKDDILEVMRPLKTFGKVAVYGALFEVLNDDKKIQITLTPY